MTETISSTTLDTIRKLEEAHQQVIADAEAVTRDRYPDLNIVPGSMQQHIDGPYKQKRTVEVVCACGTHVTRATSDLHTFIGCPVCLKGVRKANKKGGQASLLLQIASLKAQLAAATPKEGEGQPS